MGDSVPRAAASLGDGRQAAKPNLPRNLNLGQLPVAAGFRVSATDSQLSDLDY